MIVASVVAHPDKTSVDAADGEDPVLAGAESNGPRSQSMGGCSSTLVRRAPPP